MASWTSHACQISFSESTLHFDYSSNENLKGWGVKCVVTVTVGSDNISHALLSSLKRDERFFFLLACRYGVTPENIILYGQSIGTVPTVDLAARYECAAVILHSPLMSGLRVAFPDTRKTYCFDAFPRWAIPLFTKFIKAVCFFNNLTLYKIK